MPNALFCISPYQLNGQWVFDDPSRDLKAEPLISGADTLCSILFKEYGEFNLVFSDTGLPEHDFHLQRISPSGDAGGGTWYKEAALGQEAWLCPALFKYYPEAPDNIFAKASPRR